MRRFRVTWVTAALAAMSIVVDFLTELNLFHTASKLFERFAKNHVSALVTAAVLITMGLFIDVLVTGRNAKRETEIEAQRLSVLKATMRTVQEIVNNALNALQLFRLDAEGVLPPESLKLFDDITQETAEKLRALGDLESTSEAVSPLGPTINREPNSPAAKNEPL